MNRTTKIVASVASALALIGTAACTGQNSLTGGGGAKDLKHLPPQDPDFAVLLNNVDKYPNVAILCYRGVALATTTRDAAGAIQHFDALDKVCPGYVQPPAR